MSLEYPLLALCRPSCLGYYISELDPEVWQAFVEVHWITTQYEIALYK